MHRHCVYIVSRSCFQKKLLASYVEKNTKMHCLCIAEDDWHQIINDSINGKKIVLWDCLNIDCEHLDNRLTRLLNHFSDQCIITLFNVNNCHKDKSNFVAKWLYGVFYENDSPENLVKGIKAISHGELWFSRLTMTTFILENQNRMRNNFAKTPPLTAREKEILVQITSGAGNKEIAEKLCVSQYTVKSHLYNIFKKINVTTRGQASNWASKNHNHLIQKHDKQPAT